MINFTTNNTFNVFTYFSRNSLCDHLFDSYKRCNPYAIAQSVNIKGQILNNLNNYICFLGLNRLSPYCNSVNIATYIPESTPFTINFCVDRFSNSYHNISVETPMNFFPCVSYNSFYHEALSFTYIYTKSFNSSQYDFILIDINHTIVPHSIYPYYNTPNAFLNYCNHRNFQPHRVISREYFYRDFKRLLSQNKESYAISTYPSYNVYYLFDAQTNSIFLYSIIHGQRTNHYVILEVIPWYDPILPTYSFFNYGKQVF